VVLTQYKRHSLDRHIATTWRMSPLLGNYVTPVPAQMRRGPRWFAGSADPALEAPDGLLPQLVRGQQRRHVLLPERVGAHEQLGGHHQHVASLRVGHHVELHQARGRRGPSPQQPQQAAMLVRLAPFPQQAQQVGADGGVVLLAVDAADLLVDPAQVLQALFVGARIRRAEGAAGLPVV
jgi:hypothetical protein